MTAAWVACLAISKSALYFDMLNSLWPIEAIWWRRSGSTLAQVMACCLTAPSHDLNQCWLIINCVLCFHLPTISQKAFQTLIHKMSLKITCLKSEPQPSGDNELSPATNMANRHPTDPSGWDKKAAMLQLLLSSSTFVVWIFCFDSHFTETCSQGSN